MFKVKTLNNISEKGLSLLDEKYQVSEEIEDPDAILVRSFKMHEMEIPSSLKAIARAGAGVNNIPVDLCTEKGIVVFNTPGANANGVKELVIAGLLLSSRKIVQGIEWGKTLIGQGSEVPKLIEKGKKAFVGPEILGKKLGVIGLGAIGVLVANAAEALGMEVSGYDPFISIESAWCLSRTIKREVNLQKIIAESDYITLHVPLAPETKDMIDQEMFNIMKKDVRLLNFSRDGIINNEALKQALENKAVASYVTDFPDEALIALENVIAIPHLGASTLESEDNCAMMAVREIKDYLENGNICHSVNFPNCVLNRNGSLYRISIIHQNKPNMVGQITTVLANEEINIVEMVNKSKGENAYTLLNLDHEPTVDSVKELNDIDGVIKVRVI